MSEILRLRMARAPQRVINRNVLGALPPNAEAKLPARDAGTLQPGPSFMQQLLASPDSASRRAKAFAQTTQFVGRGSALAVPIREFDVWLVEHDNRVSPAQLESELNKLLHGSTRAVVASANWRTERTRVFDSLIAAIVARVDPATCSELTRLLLLFGLVESMAALPPALSTTQDVQDALRYRTILLPKEIFTLVPRHGRLARRYGFADLFVVRDEWSRYEAGEIAHIENVLPHESKTRFLKTLAETEVTTVAESEHVETEEHDSQTTDRMEVQQHAQQETDSAAHVAAQVETEASYGPMHIAATVGGSFDYSQKNAEDHAYQQSHEFVSRAVRRVEERVKTARTTRSLQRTVERNKHVLDNQTGDPVVGLYRWVDKVQRMQIYRYPHRLLLEFQIPEPAAFLTWRRGQPRGDFLTPEPVELIRRKVDSTPLLDGDGKKQPLQPQDITESNYQWWVAQYNVTGVSTPPSLHVQVHAFLELKEQVAAGSGGGSNSGLGGSTVTTLDSTYDKTLVDLIGPGGTASSEPGVAIPNGYRLESWGANGYASNVIATLLDNSRFTFTPDLNILVGLTSLHLQGRESVDLSMLQAGTPTTQIGTLNKTWRFDGVIPSTAYPAGSPVTGQIPVTARAMTTKECRVHVTLNCVRMPEALAKWQQQTYEQVAAAYWALKRQRADEQAAQATGQGIEIKGDSTARNKEVIVEELKRGVIEMLLGTNFDGRNAMQEVPKDSPPLVDLDAAASYAAEIQFIEQAFEWENLTYVLYPYFWAKYERWPALADVTLADAEFARFVRSGSARVVVPARPKFEAEVCMYVDFGVLWGGGPVPTVDDPDYLSIAAEIVAQQQPPVDGEKRQSWEVRLPTTLVWLDSDSSLPKNNPSPNLDTPPGVPTP